MIRILIVEDSAVQRELLRFVLDEAGGFDIVGTATDGEDAIKQAAALKPDVILMDCHMPKMDGIAATRIIMETRATPIVIASATSLRGDAEFPFEAIRNGALAVVNKPAAPGVPDYDRVAATLVRTLRLMSEVRVVRRWPAQSAGAVPRVVLTRPPDRSVVAMVALTGSTGAPHVIADILGGIAPDLCVPVLIVQHMTEGFSPGFASWLTTRTGVPVQIAAHGERTQPGRAYIAPDGAHMGVDARGVIALTTGAEIDGFRPSATALLTSVADAFGARAMGVVLTGMGRDGAAGLLRVKQAGGVTAVQDETTSVVFGMPAEAIRLGAASHVLTPPAIMTMIRSFTR